MNGKSAVKLIISTVVGLVLGLIIGIIYIILKILFPNNLGIITDIYKYTAIGLICIAIVVVFIIMFIATIQEFNFMKLYNNELTYNGLSEEIYRAASKRKRRYKNNKYSVGYIESANIIANYFASIEKYDEAIGHIEEFDFNELKKKLKIDSNNPSRTNLVTFFSLADSAISLYAEIDYKEKADEVYSVIQPLYNKYVSKYDFLTNILYEANFKYQLYKENFEEAKSILYILKNTEPFFYYAFKLEYIRAAKEFDEEKIESTLKKAYENAETQVYKKFSIQSVDLAKKHLYEAMNKEA